MLVKETIIKICTKCNIAQPLTEYHKNKLGKDGRQPRCRSCLHEAQRQYRKTNGYGASIKYRYGITLEEYKQKLLEQNNQCKICSIIFESTLDRKSTPVIDHDHTTGKMRGIICHPCNVCLGLAKDNTDTLQKMIRYLECC